MTKIDLPLQKITQDIRNGKSLTQIAKELGVNRLTVAARLKEAGLSKESVKFNHDFFEIINSEEKAYWLGFIMADGCVSKTHGSKVVIKLAKKDGHHLKKWHTTIDSNLNIHWMQSGVQSQHYSSKMCADLIILGCTPKKTLTLKFPNLNKLLYRHFIRGYFDGDGCADMRKHQKTPQLRLSFVGTERFLTKLKSILKLNNKLQPTGNNKSAFSLQICGNKKAKKIANWMYKDATIFLERKREVCFADL